MSRLSAKARAKIPAAEFAGPGRSFPIEDAGHAKAALALAGHAADPSAVRAAVHRKYPNMGSRKAGSKQRHGLTHMAHVSHPRSR